MSMDETVFQKVLSNPLIVRNVMRYSLQLCTTCDELQNTIDHSRLNRAFNSALRGALSSNYTKLNILLVVSKDRKPRREPAMKVNGCLIEQREFSSLGKYIVKKMGVKVEELRLRDEYGLNSDDGRCFNRRLHSIIKNHWIRDNKSHVTALTGMLEVCRSGCSWCTEMAHIVKEWGSPQRTFLEQNFEFETMRITEKKLFDLAGQLLFTALNQELFIQRMEEEINEKIRCKTLIIELYKSVNTETKCPVYYMKSNTIPLEILERMLTAWKVEHLVIDFVELESKDGITEGHWIDSHASQPFFTPYCMEHQYTKSKTSTHLLETLEVTGMGAMDGDVTLFDLISRLRIYSDNLKTFQAKKTKVRLQFNICAAKETESDVKKFKEQMEHIEQGRIEWDVGVKLCASEEHRKVLNVYS